MPGIEQLIRESLTARAQDVETTPMLWLEVDRRVARRKRFQVTAWSLAGATTALAGVLAVPAIVDLMNGDSRTPEISAVPETALAGVVPEFYVTDVDGELTVWNLASGEGQVLRTSPGTVSTDLEVRPGSTGRDYAVATVQPATGGEPTRLFVNGVSGPGNTGTSLTLTEFEDAPEFVPDVVWAPDQAALATTVPMPE
ncbi:MAG TPA: hypothetical protein VK906_05100, partial [Egicoccus sp.]